MVIQIKGVNDIKTVVTALIVSEGKGRGNGIRNKIEEFQRGESKYNKSTSTKVNSSKYSTKRRISHCTLQDETKMSYKLR